jgi:hypothetical protein
MLGSNLHSAHAHNMGAFRGIGFPPQTMCDYIDKKAGSEQMYAQGQQITRAKHTQSLNVSIRTQMYLAAHARKQQVLSNITKFNEPWR